MTLSLSFDVSSGYKPNFKEMNCICIDKSKVFKTSWATLKYNQLKGSPDVNFSLILMRHWAWAKQDLQESITSDSYCPVLLSKN
jgi:hypothetical protein